MYRRLHRSAHYLLYVILQYSTLPTYLSLDCPKRCSFPGLAIVSLRPLDYTGADSHRCRSPLDDESTNSEEQYG